MKRRMGFGVGKQGFHPRARSTLSVEARRGMSRMARAHEMTANYFVPSFSIHRHIYHTEEAHWSGVRKQIGSVLGRHFEITPLDDINVKSIEQKALIHKIRQTGERPSGDDMHDVVKNIHEDLVQMLSDTPEKLELGLGRLAVFGRNQNKLAFTLEGWKGWRGRYGEDNEIGRIGELLLQNEVAVDTLALDDWRYRHENEDRMRGVSALGALLLENKIAMGNISTAFPDMNFALSEIATNPHITIAKSRDSIRDHELRRYQAQIDELDISSIIVGDPVISYKLGPRQESESLLVRHSWASLAVPDIAEIA